MQYYFELAVKDGRTKAKNYLEFYCFTPTMVAELHTTRFSSPLMLKGLWFRLESGSVFDALSARQLSHHESKRELFDISLN